MAKKQSRQKRVWLAPNDPDSFSSASYSIDKYDEDSVNVRIADCNRVVTIYFSGKQGLKKFDRMLNVLQEARDELDKEIRGE